MIPWHLPTWVKRPSAAGWLRKFSTYRQACEFVSRTIGEWEIFRESESRSFLLVGYGLPKNEPIKLNRVEIGHLPYPARGKKTVVNYTIQKVTRHKVPEFQSRGARWK